MNKTRGGDRIPVELFQILKDDAVKVLHSICQQIWKTQQWPQDWKRSVFIPIPKKGNPKECSNYRTIALIHIMNSLLPNSHLLKKVGKTTRPFRYGLNQIPYDYIVEVRNRFMGLDLILRVPDELWTEVRDIVQETGIKTIPMEKKCKKEKWLSKEALQIAVKRREVKKYKG